MELLEPLKPLPWEPIVVAPLGDLQAGSAGTDWDALRRHIERGQKLGVWWFGTGDMSDWLSPSGRRALRHADFYDTPMDMLERWHGEHLEQIKEVLAPTVGHWLCLHEGHHFHEYGPADTTDTRLADYLGCHFAGTSSITRLQFKSDQLQRSADCLIYGVHGEGATANPVHRLLRVAPGFPQVDIFIQGHNCQLGSQHLDCIEVYGRYGHLKMRNRRQHFVAAGGFMRGYAAGSRLGGKGRAQGSYVEKALMRPTAIGAPFIRISPVAKSDYSAVEISVESGD